MKQSSELYKTIPRTQEAVCDDQVSAAVVAEDGETVCAVGGGVLRVHCQRRNRQLRSAAVDTCTPQSGF